MQNLLSQTNRVLGWWASLPEHERRDWYLPRELGALVGIAPQALEVPAVLAGWTRVRRRIAPGQRAWLYVPPGRTCPYFAVGKDAIRARLHGLPSGMAFFGDPPTIHVLDRAPL